MSAATSRKIHSSRGPWIAGLAGGALAPGFTGGAGGTYDGPRTIVPCSDACTSARLVDAS